MNLDYLSLYLVLPWYHLSEFCSFPSIDLVHILLGLYLSISFWVGSNVNGIIFLILDYTCPLLVYKKVIHYYILTSYLTTLLYWLISFRNFFLDNLHRWSCRPWPKTVLCLLYQSVCFFFSFLGLLHLRTFSVMLKWSGEREIFVLSLILVGKYWVSHY